MHVDVDIIFAFPRAVTLEHFPVLFQFAGVEADQLVGRCIAFKFLRHDSQPKQGAGNIDVRTLFVFIVFLLGGTRAGIDRQSRRLHVHVVADVNPANWRIDVNILVFFTVFLHVDAAT